MKHYEHYPSKETLQLLFSYDDELGRLRHKEPCKYNPRKLGAVAGHYRFKDGLPYGRLIRIQGRNFEEHVLIYIYHYGYVPPNKTIDHADRDRSNNHIENLRPASKAQQQFNQLHRGFHFRKSRNKWVVRIAMGDALINAGSYSTALQARLAYEAKGLELHEEFFPPCFFTEAIKDLLKDGGPPITTSNSYNFLSN